MDVASRIKKLIAQKARATFGPEVLSDIGFFGGLYELKNYRNPVLISHVDGVGTKVKIAAALGRYNTVGIDLVNHCVNDIFTCGASPLFFQDYVGMGTLKEEQVAALSEGLVSACKDVGCALIGGETAEMPGLYTGDDFDLVGFIVGVVEKDRIMLGKTIAAGDVVIGLPSTGLHTNGYSLARRVLGESRKAMEQFYPELGRTAGDALLEPHRCYFNQLKPLLEDVKGMAHITGTGLIGNLPRVLPEGLATKLDSKTWAVPPIFEVIRKKGNIEQREMYLAFNMGIGMAVICSPENSKKLTGSLPDAKVIGQVIKQSGRERVFIDGTGYHREKVQKL